jgi:hypothetical protein
MIVLSFKSQKKLDSTLEVAKMMEKYATELVDCLEEAKDSHDYEDEEYDERNYRNYRSEDPSYKRGRYGYRR